MLDPQAGEGAADLGEVRAIDAAARGRGVEGPAGAIGVEGDGQAVGLEDLPQGRHHRLGRFLRPEPGGEQALGGVVDHGEQRLPRLGDERQPGMRAAVEVEELAETGRGARGGGDGGPGRGPCGRGPRPAGRA